MWNALTFPSPDQAFEHQNLNHVSYTNQLIKKKANKPGQLTI